MSNPGLLVGAMFVGTAGISSIGAMGNLMELFVKEIDKDKNSILRKVGEVFF